MVETETGQLRTLSGRLKQIFRRPSPVDQECLTHQEITDISPHLERLLEFIIASGKFYDMIIGDDTSGRIPTLVIGKVLNNLNAENGNEPMPVRFVGRNWKSQDSIGLELNNILRHCDKKLRRVLVVTEYMASGSTVKNLSDYLEQRRLDFDVASLAVQSSEKEYRSRCTFPEGTQLYVGSSGEGSPSIHDTVSLTGLVRGVPLQLRVTRFYADRSNVSAARKDVSVLATRLSEQLKHR